MLISQVGFHITVHANTIVLNTISYIPHLDLSLKTKTHGKSAEKITILAIYVPVTELQSFVSIQTFS